MRNVQDLVLYLACALGIDGISRCTLAWHAPVVFGSIQCCPMFAQIALLILRKRSYNSVPVVIAGIWRVMSVTLASMHRWQEHGFRLCILSQSWHQAKLGYTCWKRHLPLSCRPFAHSFTSNIGCTTRWFAVLLRQPYLWAVTVVQGIDSCPFGLSIGSCLYLQCMWA